MGNTQCRTWILTKTWKTWKMRHKHCKAWNMTRNTEKSEK